jgi:putative transposase
LTRLDFTGRLAAAGLQLSMAGRGRALDNGFVARLWRTGKDAEGDLKEYETPREAMEG